MFSTADPEGSLEAVEAALKDRPVLVAMDNVEQIEGIGAVVTDLLRALPELRVVVTSRTRLNARGETEFAVAPLALPTSRSSAAGANTGRPGQAAPGGHR